MKSTFNVTLPSGDRVWCEVGYTTIEPAETGTDFGHAWILSPPKVMDLTLLECHHRAAPGEPIKLTPEEIKFILNHAENLILAGEGL